MGRGSDWGRGRFWGFEGACEDAVDNLGDGAVAGDVAGGAEGIHGDVEGNHEGVVGVGESEHRAEYAQRSHDGAARDTRSGDDGYAEHGDERHEQGKRIVVAEGDDEGEGTCYNL